MRLSLLPSGTHQRPQAAANALPTSTYRQRHPRACTVGTVHWRCASHAQAHLTHHARRVRIAVRCSASAVSTCERYGHFSRPHPGSPPAPASPPTRAPIVRDSPITPARVQLQVCFPAMSRPIRPLGFASNKGRTDSNEQATNPALREFGYIYPVSPDYFPAPPTRCKHSIVTMDAPRITTIPHS